MKEISYDSSRFDKENEEQNKKQIQSRGSTKAPAVRTFRADVEGLIQEKGVTKNDITMAEAARRESRGESRFPVEEEGSHLGRIIFILLLVLAFGIGTGMYALIGTKITIPFLAVSTSTPVTTDDVSIDISHSPPEQIFADISLSFGKTALPNGSERAVNFITKSADGSSVGATLQQFLKAVNASQASLPLPTFVDPELSYHIHSGTALTGVITLHTRSYPDAFATLLEWEPSMANDLIPILNPWYSRKDLKNLDGRMFHDELIGTVNARILSDVLGKSLLAYAFVDKKTLYIAGSRETLAAQLPTTPVVTTQK